VEVLASSNFTHVDVIYDLDTAGREGSWRAAAALEVERHGRARVLSLPETLGAKADVSTFYAHVGADDARFRAELAALEESPKPSDLTFEDQTDTDNATRFVDLHRARLHHIAKWKRWLVFFPQKHRWHQDHGDIEVRELAKDVGRSIHKDLPKIPTHQLNDASKLIKKCLSNPGIKAMVDLARGVSGILLDHEELDADPWLLGVKNGVVDLRTGELRPGAPEDLITLQCPVDYDPEADCPRFLQAMDEWQDDEEVRRYIQRLAGYALVGKQEEHIFVIHFGTGANGKSSFVKALQNVLGPYAMVPSLSVLVNTGRKEHDTVRAAFFRKRLAIGSETQQRVSLDEASIKNLTGNDRMSVRGVFENPWEFDPTHTLWLCTNYLPEIDGRDPGIWRRPKVVPWLATFTGKSIDKDLDEQLQAEAPGILRWMIQGCVDWQEHRLEEPDAVKRASLEYREAEDVLRAFVNECGLLFEPQLEISASELVGLLYDWCKEENRKTPKGMSDWLEENGCKKIQRRKMVEGKEKKPRYWIGVGLSSDDPEKETDETV
jgi:putative DNA primase/helicase